VEALQLHADEIRHSLLHQLTLSWGMKKTCAVRSLRGRDHPFDGWRTCRLHYWWYYGDVMPAYDGYT